MKRMNRGISVFSIVMLMLSLLSSPAAAMTAPVTAKDYIVVGGDSAFTVYQAASGTAEYSQLNSFTTIDAAMLTITMAVGSGSTTLSFGATYTAGDAAPSGQCDIGASSASVGGLLYTGTYTIKGSLKGASSNCVILLNPGINCVIDGATIQNDSSNSASGAVRAVSASLTVNSGSITADTGCGILLDAYGTTNSTANINGGTIRSESNYAVYNVSAGALNISGGSLSSGATNTIYNYSTGKITISDAANITNATKYATVWLNAGTAGETILEMTGGTVSNTNDSSFVFTDAYVPTALGNNGVGNVVISGGSIQSTGFGIGNKAAGAVKISGGAITAGSSGYGVANGSTGPVYLSGAPAITGGAANLIEVSSGAIHASDGAAADYTGDALSIYYYGEITSKSTIAVADVTSGTNDAAFSCANTDADYALELIGTNLYFTKHVAINTDTTTCYDDIQTALDDALDGQTVQLLSNIRSTSQITYDSSDKSISLDLNGHALIRNVNTTDSGSDSEAAVYAESGTLTIKDTSTDADGYIKAVSTGGNGGTGLHVGIDATVNLLSGGILGCGQAITATSGGAHINISGGVVYGYANAVNSEAINVPNTTHLTISGGYIGTCNSGAAMILSNAVPAPGDWSFSGGYFTAQTCRCGSGYPSLGDFATTATVMTMSPAVTTTISESQTYSYMLMVPITITFDINGGRCATASATALPSGKLSSLPTAAKDGAIFTGWYTQDGTKVTTATVFDADTTVYAQYKDSWLAADANYYNTAWYSDSATSYTLDSAAELAGLAYLVNSGIDFSGKTVTLSKPVDVSAYLWTPIGYFAGDASFHDAVVHPFKGTFDGDNHAITGMDVLSTAYATVGLFGYTEDATIKNVSVSGSVTSTYGNGGLWTGGLVGAAGDTSIDHCSSSADVSSAFVYARGDYGYCTGGLVGQLWVTDSAASITNSCATGNANASSDVSNDIVYNYCGGLVGFALGVTGTNAVVRSCYATGDVNGESSSSANLDLGGLLGATVCATVEHCHASGNMTNSTASVNSCAGGLVGHLSTGSYLNDSDAAGSITLTGNGTYSRAGGLVGINSAAVESSYSTGAISVGGTIDSELYEGGLVGYSIGSVRNSYSTGDIITTATCPEIYLAGLIARNSGGNVTNCYSAGIITKSGSPNAAGITPGDCVCYNDGGTITDCYWLTHTTNYTSSGVLTGGTVNSITMLSADQLSNTGTIGSTNTTAGASIFSADTVVDALNAKAELSFYSKAWKVVSGTNSGYPILCGGIATVNVVKNGAATVADGAVELWQNGTRVREAANGSQTGVYCVLMLDGIYHIYIKGSDTGVTLEINGSDSHATVDCTPVSHSSGTSVRTITVSTVTSTVFAGADKSLFSAQANMTNAFSNSVEVRLTDSAAGNTEITSLVGAGGTVYPFDISLYIKDTNTKTEPTDGYAVTIMMPLPESLGAQRDTLSLVHDAGGKLEKIPFTLVQKGSVWCIQFQASKFSPYALVANSGNGLPYYLNANGAKVFIGFASDAGGTMKYLEKTGKTISFAKNPKNFSDISGHWAKDNINFVTERELFLGTADKVFSPNGGMTRAMFATVLGRLYERSYGAIASVTTGDFTDVNYTGWCGKYVKWAAENGITTGVSAGKFQPNTQITRQEMAAMLYRYAKYLGVSTADSSATTLTYSDASSISGWAANAAGYCQKTGIITGREGGAFAPQATATRAEVAVILERFINNIVG